MSIPRIAPYAIPSQLPDNRVNWTVAPQRAALLIHDMQEYFLDFYDREAEPVATALRNIAAIRARCRELNIPVFYTAQPAEQADNDRGLLNDMWGPGLPARPERHPIVASLSPADDDTVLTKWRYSAFQRSPFLNLLRQQGRDQLIICGIYAHIGCMSTALDAFMYDIQPFFVADGLADFSAERHAMALEYVAQRCGVTLDSQRLLNQLAAPTSAAPSAEALRAAVAELLQQPASDIGLDDNLLDWGLDSIRLMSLLEQWRALGAEIDFIELAQQPSVNAWQALLARQLDRVAA
ncbi:isochorismatase family protein [Chromobacterium sp. IRSSSOUMB001]|uniref:isochorismatase family protein n=1 Tax=Chromobacterium sp. IRSSSOUMB001 TaxID=2927123 RepID=UPI0020C09E1E|nr:isochorismatase family protein [Chromobacterium sp. IRSSSOUMB001]